MANRIGISVVICAHDVGRWSDLLSAVHSVRTQTFAPQEIIAVIDHAPPLFERARTGLRHVRVAENTHPRGLSGARNTGVALARGAVVAFLDDDAVAAPDWLARLSAHYVDPGVLGVGGSIVPVWRDGRPQWFPDEFDWVVGCTYRGMPSDTACVRNLIGANMSLRRQVFDVCGGFRSEIGRIGALPLGGEETELCIRAQLRQPGCSLLYEPRAIVYHRVPARRARWAYFASRCFAEGITKALVSRFVGRRRSLTAERAYALYTLPRGVFRSVAYAVRRRDSTGLARAGAIIAGLAITTAGYARGLFVRDLSLDSACRAISTSGVEPV